MSVEILGVSGYEYQYFLTVWYMLNYLDTNVKKFLVEKINEEDSQIVFTKNNKDIIIDLQMKSRTNCIGIKEFAKWLAHFENRTEKEFLLKKLMDNENRYIVFLTDFRVNDDMNYFVIKDSFHQVHKDRIKLDNFENLKSNICEIYKKNTKLSKKRNNTLSDFFNSYKKDEIINMLRHVNIKEYVNVLEVGKKIENILHDRHYIPYSKTSIVLNELLDIIKKERGTGNCVVSRFQIAINKYSSQKIFEVDCYIERKERDYRKIIEKENVLLLTGVSFSGKTTLARKIADEYRLNRYDIFQTGELNNDCGAINIINSFAKENRLVILDDPFGSIEAKSDIYEIQKKILELIRKTDKHRKLIITSRSDILDKLYEDKQKKLHNHRWYNLTCNDYSSVKDLWKYYYGDGEKNNEKFEEVRNYIKSSEKLSALQLGHINNLYNKYNCIDELLNENIDDIVKTCFIDSDMLKKNIKGKNQKYIDVCMLLGLVCDTNRYVDYNILLELLKDKRVFNYLEKNYETGQINEVLIYLKTYGYIDIDDKKQIVFRHPIYLYSCQLLFEDEFNNILSKKNMLKIVENILRNDKTNKNVIFCTLNIIERMYLNLNKNELKELILIGLESKYPAVRDKVIYFFEKRIDKLNKKEQKSIVNVVTYKKDWLKIEWEGDEPVYSKKSKDYLDVLNEFDCEKTDDFIFDETQKYSTKWIYEKVKQKNISIETLNLALTCDESFIKSEAIKRLVTEYSNEIDIEKYLKSNETHNYVYSLFKNSLDVWLKYNEIDREKIKEYFIKNLDRFSVAILSRKFLENYEDEYKSFSLNWNDITDDDKVVYWDLWYDIYTAFLIKFPAKFDRAHQSHMANVIEKSLKYINDEKRITNLAKIWYKWIEEYMNYRMCEDYGLSVASYLLDNTSMQSSERESICDTILSSKNTMIITSIVKSYIDNWDKLTFNEKEKVKSVICENRVDSIWIKAVILNRQCIPEEVSQIILNCDISKITCREKIRVLREKSLLESCLNVFCGYPQPLWWLGYHHNDIGTWTNIIVNVLEMDIIDKSFDLCVREFIGKLYNRQYEKYYTYDLYDKLLKSNDKRQKFENELLKVTAYQNQKNKKMWDLLLDNCTVEEQQLIFDKIVENIEAFEYNQIDGKGLLEYLNKDIVWYKIYPKLGSDNDIRKKCNIILNLEKLSNGIVENDPCFVHILEFIRSLYQSIPPRLILTGYFVENILEKVGISDTQLDGLIEVNRKRLIEIGSEKSDNFEDEYPITNWVGLEL